MPGKSQRQGGLAHYVKQWSLSNVRGIAKTATGHVYKVSTSQGEAVLKILTAVGHDDEAVGAVALRFFDGHGAVRLLQADAGEQLLEYVSGSDLTELVLNGRDDEATRHIALVLRTLHSTAPKGMLRGFPRI